jgi:hypothetical protein
MIPKEVSKIIRYLEERADQLNEKGRAFVRDMVERLDRHGDKLYCTWKQRTYLIGLYAITQKTEPEKPKSRLEELKERRAKLLSKTGKRRRRKGRATTLEAMGATRIIKEMALATPVTARMTHRKNIDRQLDNNKLLIRGTKRDK